MSGEPIAIHGLRQMGALVHAKEYDLWDMGLMCIVLLLVLGSFGRSGPDFFGEEANSGKDHARGVQTPFVEHEDEQEHEDQKA